MTARQLFAIPFISLSCVGFVHSLLTLWRGDGSPVWFAAAIATMPAALLFASLLTLRVPRTAPNLPFLLGAGAVAGLGAIVAAVTVVVQPLPLAYAVLVGLIGGPVYVAWYSRLPAPGDVLAVGEPLPDFTLTGLDGAPVSSSALRGQPAILMFFRGNWCPLCMAQIGEVTRRYQEIEARGAAMWLISGQSDTHTQLLAKVRKVGFVHLRDEGLVVARQLGLHHAAATPTGMGALGFDDDAYLPTVVVVDAKGVVRWAETTDNYRVRPEPDTFLRVLDTLPRQ